MADISMCSNSTCPSRKECYRFRAIANPHRQSQASFKPDEGKKKCDYFMSILKKDKLTEFKEEV
tara:strand:+ start:194 stop:385 length:192 start_codon:yes stop_codon:yes gene_type:complete